MENMGEWEQKSLVNELKMGKEYARQLQIHLSMPSSSMETRDMLAQKILESYDKSLRMLNLSSSSPQMGEANVVPGGKAAVGMPESPTFMSGSPRSEDSDREFKDQETNKEGLRERKNMPRWTQQVRTSAGEEPPQDGYSWRKYGQKDILGAKFPRGYYRCTYRNLQGCLATKQIQRSDQDPTILDITYRGKHTCNQGNTSPNNLLPPPLPPQVTPMETQDPNNTHTEPHQPQQHLQAQELLFNDCTGLKLITQDLQTHQEDSCPSFHFPSTTTTTTTTTTTLLHTDQTQIGSSSIFDSNSFFAYFSPTFMSPPTSPGTSSSFFGHNQLAVSELSEIFKTISASTSAANSPTIDLDFPYKNVTEFDPSFTFDNPPGFH